MSITERSDYDELPYVDLPVAPTQPELLAAIGRIRGMQPADVETARVLELGCGGGMNLLTMADRRPGATFLGIDSAREQIATAQDTRDRSGLANVTFRQQGILAWDAGPGTFDYIVVQGVYSLVGSAVRDKIMAICRDHLAPQGIAFISYNAYPGWQIHDMLRHMMLYEARHAKGTGELLERGRAFAEFLRHSLDARQGAYEALVQVELGRLLQPEKAYLRHDHMGDVCQAFHFHEFIDYAQKHHLQLLGDCTLGIRYTDEFEVDVEQRLDDLTSDPVLKEQFRDLLRNRPLRQSLLCHEAVELRRSSAPEQLEGLFLEAQLRPQNAEVSLISSESQVFVTPDGWQISTAVPLIKAALAELGEIWPQSTSFESLIEAARARLLAAEPTREISEADIRRLKENLVHSCYGRLVEVLSVAPHPFVTTISQQPMASPLAQLQARRGAVVTNRKHQSLRLDYFDQHVLMLLDGVRNLQQLFEELTRMAVEGQLTALEDGQRIQELGELQTLLATVLPQSLSRLERNAFLIG